MTEWRAYFVCKRIETSVIISQEVADKQELLDSSEKHCL